jgi:hypothetical protein
MEIFQSYMPTYCIRRSDLFDRRNAKTKGKNVYCPVTVASQYVGSITASNSSNFCYREIRGRLYPHSFANIRAY